MESLTPKLSAYINQTRLDYTEKIYTVTKRMVIEADDAKLIELITKKKSLLDALIGYEKKLFPHLKTLNDLNFPENFRKEYTKRLHSSAKIHQIVINKYTKIHDKLSKELHGFDIRRKLEKYLTAP